MRIVHVVRQFYPCIGGLENAVRAIAQAQVSDGHRVCVVTLDRSFTDSSPLEPAQDELDGIEIRRIPFKGSRRYPIAPQVLRHIKDADIVHVHAIDFFFDFLAFTAPFHRKKLVVTPHGGFFHTAFAARLKKLYFHIVTRSALRFYRALISLGHNDYEAFKAIRKEGMVWWPCGVDTGKFRGAGARQPRKALFTLSRFSVNKRIDRLMDFLAAIRRRDPEWRLVLAGTEWDYNEASLKDMAQRKGVLEAITFLVRAQDTALKDAMGQASVFVSASDYEGFGIAAVEGLSAGMLPLLSPIPSYTEIVAQAGLGLNVDFANPEQASEEFLSLWNRIIPVYGQMREAAMRASEPYDWSSVARRFLPVYEAALGVRTRKIGGVMVQALRENEAKALIAQHLERGPAMHVAYANAHALNIAATDEAFRNALDRALVLNDGIGLDIASRLLFGNRFPDNLNGTDFTPDFLKSITRPLKVYLLGAKPGIAEKASAKLRQIAPQHTIVGARDGYFGPNDNAGVVSQIRTSQADVLLVALGNPLQELWLDQNLKATGCKIGFSVGALFDFLADEVPRAPEWVRKARLEWVYRLAQEPGRLWKRYLVGNAVFLGRTMGQWIGGARA